VLFKFAIALGIGLLVGQGVGLAQQCPPDCPLKGGGPAASDCLVEFGGVTPSSANSRVVRCDDGDPSCDQDPQPGVCGFDVSACLNNADPALPQCAITGVDEIRVRGGGQGGKDLGAALEALLPSSDNVCTEPVRISVPINGQGRPPLGRRRVQLSENASTFGINGLALGTFKGFVEFEAGAPDPATGLAIVDVVDSSEYIEAFVPLGGITLCLKPEPVQGAGVISCGSPAGRSLRVNARFAGGEHYDRDGFLLQCRSSVNYTTYLTVDHNIGVVGVDGFTEEDCSAAGGNIENRMGQRICNGSFQTGQLDELSAAPGEMILAPIPPLVGFPVQIVQERNPPCGDEGPSGGMSTSIAITTMRSAAKIFDADNIPGEEREFDIQGEPFSCDDFSEPGSGGVLVFAAPQLNLPILGDGVTQFRFTDTE